MLEILNGSRGVQSFATETLRLAGNILQALPGRLQDKVCYIPRGAGASVSE